MLQVQGAALVVEPMPLVAAVAAEILLELGFEQVELAAGVDAAVDLIARFRFRFALLAVVHRNGEITEVTERLDQGGVPYMLVSDLADGRDRPPELLQSRFVTKPYGFADIAEALGYEPPVCAVQ
jgi:CheY-like chemotaxis protein